MKTLSKICGLALGLVIVAAATILPHASAQSTTHVNNQYTKPKTLNVLRIKSANYGISRKVKITHGETIGVFLEKRLPGKTVWALPNTPTLKCAPSTSSPDTYAECTANHTGRTYHNHKVGAGTSDGLYTTNKVEVFIVPSTASQPTAQPAVQPTATPAPYNPTTSYDPHAYARQCSTIPWNGQGGSYYEAKRKDWTFLVVNSKTRKPSADCTPDDWVVTLRDQKTPANVQWRWKGDQIWIDKEHIIRELNVQAVRYHMVGHQKTWPHGFWLPALANTPTATVTNGGGGGGIIAPTAQNTSTPTIVQVSNTSNHQPNPNPAPLIAQSPSRTLPLSSCVIMPTRTRSGLGFYYDLILKKRRMISFMLVNPSTGQPSADCTVSKWTLTNFTNRGTITPVKMKSNKEQVWIDKNSLPPGVLMNLRAITETKLTNAAGNTYVEYAETAPLPFYIPKQK